MRKRTPSEIKAYGDGYAEAYKQFCHLLEKNDKDKAVRKMELFAKAVEITVETATDEPQTYVINPQEPTNDDKCFECDDFFTCGGQCNKIEDEPQTSKGVSYSDHTDYDVPKTYVTWTEPQTDCAWK